MRKVLPVVLFLTFVGAVVSGWFNSTARAPEGAAADEEFIFAGNTARRVSTTAIQPSRRQPAASPERRADDANTEAASALAPLPEGSVPAVSSTVPELRRPSYRGFDGNYRSAYTRRSSSGWSGAYGVSAGFGGVGGIGGGASGGRTSGPVAASSRFPAVAGESRISGVAAPSSGGGSGSGGGGRAASAAFPAPAVAGAGGVLSDGDVTDPFGAGGAPSPAPTPEPTTMLLIGTGLVGLYRLRHYLG